MSTFSGMLFEMTHPSLAAHDILHRGLLQLQKQWSAMNALMSTFPSKLFEMTHPSLAAHDILHRGLLLQLQKQWSGFMWPGGGCCLAII